jgi:hypothetical protein
MLSNMVRRTAIRGSLLIVSSNGRTLDPFATGASLRESRFPIFDVMKICRSAVIGCVSFGFCVSLAFVEPARAAEPEMSGSIKEVMSPEEFKAAGLNKLSADELQKLDAWLQGYRQVTEQAAEKKATAKASAESHAKMDLLVSRVDGSFQGLTGRTIIRLEDGTVWKQANAEDRYRSKVTDHPAAAVIHGVFGYKMRIEGTQDFYVDPVRKP